MNNKQNSSSGLALGMCIGLAIGVGIGVATNNIGVWMAIGLGIGVCIGSALSAGSGRQQGTAAGRHVKPPVQIREDVWQFTEGEKPYDVNAYLIIGERSALLVDALQSETGILEEIRKLTDKPLEVFLTHGHSDHAGPAVLEFRGAGIPVYMNRRDDEMLSGRDGYGPDMDWLADLEPGHVFDLGGYRFEILPVEGQTRGSMAALDKEHGLLFSGDSIGSGNFWMQLPGCSPLHVFRNDLEKLAAACAECPELLVFPGHRSQSPVQLTGQYVQDTLYLTNGLLDGSMKGEPETMPWNNREMKYAKIGYGQMVSYCYNPDNL